MTPAALSPAAMRIIEWLGELGPRWGLPGDGCRVHGLLYLFARPLTAKEIATLLLLDSQQTENAIQWLVSDALISQAAGGWQTGTDPWTLMMQALETRRARELATARTVSDAWAHDYSDREDQIMARQAARLFALVDDIAAIDAGARHFSPAAMRRLVGVGGRAARVIDRALGGRRRGG